VTPQFKLRLISICAWQLVCLAILFIYPHTIAHVVLAAYTAWFGDIQASYATYARVATYVAIVTITSPASLITLLIFDGLTHRQLRWKRMLVGFLAWQLLAVAILIWSFESGFPYLLNQLSWTLFGPPENLYSFRNITLPRVVGWLLCTTPVGLLALWIYSEPKWRFSLRTLLVATALVAVGLGVIISTS
jgi:hypothetical protein